MEERPTAEGRLYPHENSLPNCSELGPSRDVWSDERGRGAGMSDVITDRAEAMLVGYEDSEPVVTKPVPISRVAPAPARTGETIACTWCGSFSLPGPGCDACGSPLTG